MGWRNWRSASVALASAVGLAGCWPAVGQGPDRAAFNGVESGITPATVAQLQVAWSESFAHVIGPGQGSESGGPITAIVASPERAVVTHADRLTALGLRTGGGGWSVPGGPWDNPILNGDEVTVTSGTVGATMSRFAEASGAPRGTATNRLDARRGSHTLQQNTTFDPGTFTSSSAFSVVDDDDAGATWGAVYASGSLVTGYPLTLGARRVYAAGFGPIPGQAAQRTGLRAFADGPAACPPSGGCLAWGLPLDGTPTTPVLSPDETLVFTISSGTVYAVDAATGDVRWTAAVTSPAGLPALAEGVLYVPTAAGVLAFAAEGCGAATCDPQFRLPTAAPVSGQPAVAGGLVYAGTSAGIEAFPAAGCGAATCANLWSHALAGGASSPVVAYGNVLVASETADEAMIVNFRLPG